jgi:hypothetical protein
MPAYLERYRDGDCVQVWEELIALGEGIRQAPIYDDARAVARETMERARRNIEQLYRRLQSIGYRFECEKPRPRQDPMDQVRDQLAKNSLMDTMFGDMLKNVESMQEQLAQVRNAGSKEPRPPDNRAFTPPPDDIAQRLDAFENVIGKIPLSVRAWCENVGRVNFMGDYPGLASFQHEDFDIRAIIRRVLRQNPDVVKDYKDLDEAQIKAYTEHLPFPTKTKMGLHRLFREEIESGRVSESPDDSPTIWAGDPLFFIFEIDDERARALMEDQLEDPPLEEPGTYELVVAPDSSHKANLSGGHYSIMLPDPRADTPLHGTDLYFVAYLRSSFLWGGFPDLKTHQGRDDELIAYLKEGLEPI